MHDLDDTLMEYEPEMEAYEYEYEDEFEDEFESYEMESPFDEAEEMQLAMELLEVSDEEELEQFLGKLIKKAGRAARKFMKSSTGRALKGILRGAARKALPILGGAVGTAFGGPAGGALGSRFASMAGRAFGLELEGLSMEDQELEVAKGFVRFAGAAAKKAAKAPASVPGKVAAKKAVKSAAKAHAPGLIGSGSTGAAVGRRRSGRWVRRGSRIILMGA